MQKSWRRYYHHSKCRSYFYFSCWGWQKLYISVGISFRQCSQLLLHSKEITVLGAMGNTSIGKVMQVVRYTCAFNFKSIPSVLDHLWAFSIDMYAGTKVSFPYLDVRVRLVLRRQPFIIHFVALPMYETHKGEDQRMEPQINMETTKMLLHFSMTCAFRGFLLSLVWC